MEGYSIVEKITHGNWICEIIRDKEGYHFAVCRFTGLTRKKPILIPVVEFELCSKELLEEKYPILPKPLVDKLVGTCKLLVLKTKVKK